MFMAPTERISETLAIPDFSLSATTLPKVPFVQYLK